jgi:predicted nucleic acid-binding protein
MKNALFVDTAGWVMLVDKADPLHGAACSARDATLDAGGMLVSTDYVVDETLTLLRRRFGIDVAERWWDRAEGSVRVRWEPVDSERAERARHWFFRWRDKGFSFTDCTSFVVMRERRLRRALTSDAHFVQAGFVRVPG